MPILSVCLTLIFVPVVISDTIPCENHVDCYSTGVRGRTIPGWESWLDAGCQCTKAKICQIEHKTGGKAGNWYNCYRKSPDDQTDNSIRLIPAPTRAKGSKDSPNSTPSTQDNSETEEHIGKGDPGSQNGNTKAPVGEVEGEPTDSGSGNPTKGANGGSKNTPSSKDNSVSVDGKGILNPDGQVGKQHVTESVEEGGLTDFGPGNPTKGPNDSVNSTPTADDSALADSNSTDSNTTLGTNSSSESGKTNDKSNPEGGIIGSGFKDPSNPGSSSKGKCRGHGKSPNPDIGSKNEQVNGTAIGSTSGNSISRPSGLPDTTDGSLGVGDNKGSHTNGRRCSHKPKYVTDASGAGKAPVHDKGDRKEPGKNCNKAKPQQGDGVNSQTTPAGTGLLKLLTTKGKMHS